MVDVVFPGASQTTLQRWGKRRGCGCPMMGLSHSTSFALPAALQPLTPWRNRSILPATGKEKKEILGVESLSSESSVGPAEPFWLHYVHLRCLLLTATALFPKLQRRSRIQERDFVAWPTRSKPRRHVLVLIFSLLLGVFFLRTNTLRVQASRAVRFTAMGAVFHQTQPNNGERLCVCQSC
ncbi:hypothetical protein B0J13DRAFT_2613 [Dactylonectria estremocensis]|uniref:Uncharacterized protein n=1 Tax=Dactylonectria estremocensis TaxID=1079267 RepID=A0A9P9FI26_9HYPO|nr:hypothetical protein B0J13DRAFT_2613 [Dactylonectria estremocensis]